MCVDGLKTLMFTHDSTGVTATASQHISSWVNTYSAEHIDPNHCFCWQLFRPLALLVSRSSWKTLASSRRVGARSFLGKTLFGNDGQTETAIDDECDMRCQDVDPAQLEFFVDQLGGEWRDRIVQSNSDAMLLEGCAATLLSIADGLRASAAGSHIKRYSMAKLIKYILISALMSDSGDLAEVVWRSVDAIRPGLAKVVQEEVLKENNKVPSKATLSRYKLTLDVALMLYQQKRVTAVKMFIYMLADSSPQLRRDFFMVACTMMTDVIEAGRAQARLINSRSKRHDAGSHQRRVDTLRMDRATKQHIFPPTCLGSRRSGLAYKLDCLLHILHLERATWRCVRMFLVMLVCFTSDQGTESGLPYVPRSALTDEALAEMYPHYLEFSAEDDGLDNYISTRLRGVPENLIKSAMPFTLFVPGILHIIHGCTSDLTKNLVHFDKWFNMFKSLHHVLKSPWTRERFTATCLVGQWLYWRTRIHSITTSLLDWRWGSLLGAVHELSELEVGIRGSWNKAAINFRDESADGRARSRSAQEREDAEAKLVDADVAAKSAWMWEYAGMLLMIAHALETI